MSSSDIPAVRRAGRPASSVSEQPFSRKTAITRPISGKTSGSDGDRSAWPPGAERDGKVKLSGGLFRLTCSDHLCKDQIEIVHRHITPRKGRLGDVFGDPADRGAGGVDHQLADIDFGQGRGGDMQKRQSETAHRVSCQ